MRSIPKSAVFFVFIWFFTTLSQVRAQWDKTMPSGYISSIKTIPAGIALGEFNSGYTTSFNGIYLSKDFGGSWSSLGLKNTGVTDIAYRNGIILAATYFVINSTVGLYVSEDGGVSWVHKGPNISLSAVNMDENTIYIGSYTNGLWISQDNGVTWQQKMGTGWYGPKVETVFVDKNIVYASTQTNVYQSSDHGNTWTEVIPLRNKYIKYFASNDDVILAGSYSINNLYKSADDGLTWAKVFPTENISVSGLTYFKNCFYTGRLNQVQKYSVFKSCDNGLNWADTGLVLSSASARITDLEAVYSEPDVLFGSVTGDGVFSLYVERIFNHNPFLAKPWNKPDDTLSLIDRTTAYFDHTYPFLGYRYFSEPVEEKYSTTNFLGINGKEPVLYYSSHDGTDFGLPLGTGILAAEAGYAFYYYCTDCGNTIKIDHLNGYQTIYMHLDAKNLITTNERVWVEKGQSIGKVGMSGKTSGPHLHFAVIKDLNNNGNFGDDYPEGKTDPFGWLEENTPDPWEIYTWQDNIGTHMGTSSHYLWEENLPSLSMAASPSSPGSLVLDNRSLQFTPDSTRNPITIVISKIGKMFIPESQKNLINLPGSTFVLRAYDGLNNMVEMFTEPMEVAYQMTGQFPLNIKPETLEFYFFNTLTNLWEILPSSISDYSTYVKASTDHFSAFSVMGEKIDSTDPVTIIQLTGAVQNGWFVENPTVSFVAQDNNGIDSTYYSLDLGKIWDTFSTPFVINSEGAVTMLFRSTDIYGNYEEVNSQVIKIDTQNRWKKVITITKAVFTMSD